jgi:hypothetical protein
LLAAARKVVEKFLQEDPQIINMGWTLVPDKDEMAKALEEEVGFRQIMDPRPPYWLHEFLLHGAFLFLKRKQKPGGPEEPEESEEPEEPNKPEEPEKPENLEDRMRLKFLIGQ